MIIRENYLKKMIDAKDTEFIKVITGVRRSGKSTLLLMFKDYLINNGIKEDNIIYINFESAEFDDIKDYKDLYKYIKEKIKKGRVYLLLDEIQNVKSWEKAINSFKVDFDIDIYITGSNAYLLSSELSTLLSGRYIEIKMYPLSFKEFLKFNNYDNTNLDDKFNEYLKYGGLPAITLIKDNDELVLSYLNGIYNTIVKKDIVDRNNIKDVALLENIIKYLATNIGSSVSAKKISDFLNSNKITEKSNHQTIDNYLSMLEKSFIVYKANRTDVRNKSLLKTLGKYYISDTGIRNIILGFRNINEGHLLENVVYLELLRRGYSVNIGKSGDFEVDFVAENPNDIKYYQVAQTLANEEVKEREIRSLESISDNYEKIILTMDKTINKDYNGIKVMNIIDWLLNSD
ncbi:MAG TPA: ATP-binding protein [Candidatus Coprosoma intestinipullorum]|uniref:ATP-binding protein n=1 Tax=Candidatus Coprosoma intestinipullorum TaxID=2840752 RepID=A0A9D1CXN3_9FIRM|nr:ATP-binding protein [Candidatus Coprosoma intestinipullorum]